MAPAGLDQLGAEGQAGQIGAAAAAGLVPDPVQVPADGPDADVQLPGDLSVGPSLGDQGDQFPFPPAELSVLAGAGWLLQARDGEHEGVLGCDYLGMIFINKLLRGP